MRSPLRPKTLSSAGITPTPLLVFGAMLFASIAIRCASKADAVEGDNSGGSSTHAGGTASGGTASGGAASGGAASGGTGNVSTGGFISVGGSGGAPGAPCTVPNVANDCPLPPSVCQGPLHLTYYTAPACVAGQCIYAEQTYLCPGSCISGACGASTMTTSSMPPADPRCTGGMGGTAGNGSGGVNGEAGAGGAMGARIIIGGAGFGAGGAIATGGGSGAGMSAAGAMGSSSCELPASSCADATTLVYYTNPHCNAFLQCTYMVNTLECMGPCTNGACQGGFTAPAPP